MKRVSTTLAAIGLLFAAVSVCRADLYATLARPEPAYHWEKRAEQKVENGTIYELALISQTWQGINWDHRLYIYRPDSVAHSHFCALYNTWEEPAKNWEKRGMDLAVASGATFAVLCDNPKQPLYGGLEEDSLIVYTWMKYFKTGDESWPLHFPMAKAVIKAMDAVEEFSVAEKLPKLDSFLVCGASKRGWTSWLVGASGDKRVKAIAPMVIDTLHLAKQFPHMIEMLGAASEQIAPYTTSGITTLINTPKGQKLMQLEDPWFYRDRITVPKLIILGTNDRYWAQDALNIYWDDLIGPKWISYTPNSGHKLEDHAHVDAALAAFIDATASRKPWPKMHWSYRNGSNGVDLDLGSNIKPVAARLFHVSAPTRDFRDYKWTSEPMSATTDGFSGHLDAPDSGYSAVFGEAEYVIGGKTFTLSTQIHILSGK